jgi:hypothetical protein
MYGHKARNSLIRILTEAPELTDLYAPSDTKAEPPKPWSKVKGVRSRKLADRLLVELWMMGFAVSARVRADPAPVKGGRDPAVHKSWRNDKLLPPPKTNQSDVEVQASKPAKTP